jgi:phosphoribosylanthranilate isomerase
MTWIKICGITNLEDAQCAVKAGADALGFVFYERSPRKIDPRTAAEIVSRLPDHVERVAVCAEPMGYEFRETLLVKWTAIQSCMPSRQPSLSNVVLGPGCFTGPPRMYVSLPISDFIDDEKKLQALAANFSSFAESARAAGNEIALNAFNTFFLDSSTAHQPGGTGKTFNWQKVVRLVEIMQKDFKVVVAGGLTSMNVVEAIRTLHPWGVDVSSGVEARPGKKDPEKIRAFIAAVREAEKSAL